GWSKDQTALLIEYYQEEEGLYFIKREGYHNKFARLNALERIVEKLRPAKVDVTDLVQARKGTYNISVSKSNIQSQEREEEMCSSHSPLPIDTECWVTVAENMDAETIDHRQNEEEGLYFIKREGYHNKFARLNALERIVKKLRPAKVDVTDLVQARKGTYNISVSKSNIQSQEREEEMCSSHSPLPIDTECWVTVAENMDAETIDHRQNYTQDFVESEPSTPKTVESPRMPAKRRKLSVTSSDKFLDTAEQVLDKLSRSQESAKENEWSAFGNFIAESIEKLSTRKKQMK
ncbi:hypothetical protein CBL_21283, partial [Carabus blaptoides fortunei]